MADSPSPAVFAAIVAVIADIGKEGIAKSRKNAQQGYAFRGIDDVFNALSPLLAKHHLCILPRVVSREVTERTTSKGGALFYVVVHMEFDLVCSTDGSKHTIGAVGEAMDSGDKATNKAMSAAYKYACMQAFAIPTEGDNDADATTHQVEPRQQQQRQPAQPARQQPERQQAAKPAPSHLELAYQQATKRTNWKVAIATIAAVIGVDPKEVKELSIVPPDKELDVITALRELQA